MWGKGTFQRMIVAMSLLLLLLETMLAKEDKELTNFAVENT